MNDAPILLVDRETRARFDDHLALRLWMRLFTCTQLIERRVRDGLRTDFATTLPRFDLMAQLERHPEGLRMNELSRRLMVSDGNVTGITNQLVKEGLVDRQAEPADGRAFRVRLTRTGAKAFAEMARENEAWVIGLFSGLTPKEQRDMFHLLAKFKRHVQKGANR